jgi:hypothetical protein
MNNLAQFQPAFNGVNTLLAVSTNIETEKITNEREQLSPLEHWVADILRIFPKHPLPMMPASCVSVHVFCSFSVCVPVKWSRQHVYISFSIWNTSWPRFSNCKYFIFAHNLILGWLRKHGGGRSTVQKKWLTFTLRRDSHSFFCQTCDKN